MPDVFDEVAAEPARGDVFDQVAGTGGGDVFDQVAADPPWPAKALGTVGKAAYALNQGLTAGGVVGKPDWARCRLPGGWMCQGPVSASA